MRAFVLLGEGSWAVPATEPAWGGHSTGLVGRCPPQGGLGQGKAGAGAARDGRGWRGQGSCECAHEHACVCGHDGHTWFPV